VRVFVNVFLVTTHVTAISVNIVPSYLSIPYLTILKINY